MIIKSWYNCTNSLRFGSQIILHQERIKWYAHERSSANNYSLCLISTSDQKAVSRAFCPSKDVKNAILKKIAEKIESEMSRTTADGKTSCGIKLSVINEFKIKESQPWMDRTHLADGEVAACDGEKASVMRKEETTIMRQQENETTISVVCALWWICDFLFWFFRFIFFIHHSWCQHGDSFYIYF